MQRYKKENTQTKPLALGVEPYALLPTEIRYLQVSPDINEFILGGNFKKLSNTEKGLVIYLDKEVKDIKKEDVENNIKIFFEDYDSTRQYKSPVISNRNGFKLTKQNIYFSCKDKKPVEYYAIRTSNFIGNYDRATIVAANPSLIETIDIPIKAFIPNPVICGTKGRQGSAIEFKGQYLENVQTVRLKTDNSEIVVENVQTNEDGTKINAPLPPNTSTILSVSGITCKDNSLVAYIQQGFQIASSNLPEGPTCGCQDCFETDVFQLPPLISKVESIQTEGERHEPKLRVTLQHCDPQNCWISFENRVSGSAIREKVTIKENTLNEDNEPVQIVEVTIPNHAKVDGDIYALSNKVPGNIWNNAALACNMFQGSTSDFKLASESPCRQKAKQL